MKLSKATKEFIAKELPELAELALHQIFVLCSATYILQGLHLSTIKGSHTLLLEHQTAHKQTPHF